jgi:RecB family exonuclease
MTAEKPYVSFSRLSRYAQCPRSYELHYLRHAPAEPNPSLLFGSLMHKPLERVYQYIASAKLRGRFPTAHLLDLYAEEWKRSGLTDYAVYDEGYRILNAYAAAHSLVDGEKILGVEKEFRLPIDGVEVLGYMDRVDRIDDETIGLIDYKSNRLTFTREGIDTSLQLSIYAMAARSLWPWAKQVKLSFYLLRHGLRMETTRSEDQLDAARRYVVSLAREIETATDFPARLNSNCSYCDHRSNCDTYYDALRGNVKFKATTIDDLEVVAREREEVSHAAKVMNSRKAELEKVLKRALDERGELMLNGVRYSMFNAQKVTYPLEPTLRVLTEQTGFTRDELIAMLGTIDKDALDALVKQMSGEFDRPRLNLLKAELEAVAEKTPIPRFWAKEVRS